MYYHCVQTDPAKNVWTRAYLIPERNRTVRKQEESKNYVYLFVFCMNLGEINALLTDSQHHNLLGNQISPKSEDFCIWWSFCTLVTMATAAILNYGGYSYKSLMKGIQFFFKSPLFCFHGNCGKVCSTDSNCVGLSRST